MESLMVIEQDEVTVEPGATAQVTVRLMNPGSIVEGYNLELVGAPAQWARVVPATVNLFKATETTVTVLFQPPAGPGGPSGRLTYGVKAVSVRDPTQSLVEEAHITVGNQVALLGEVRPSQATAFRRARFRLELRNQGNVASRVRVRAQDPAEVLRIEVTAPVVEVPSGGTVLVALKVRGPWNLSAAERRHQFQVTFAEAAPDEPAWAPTEAAVSGPPAQMATASFLQRKAFGRPAKSVAGLMALAGLAFGGQRVWQRKPAAPTQLEAVLAAQPRTAELSWTPVRNVQKYQINAYKGCYEGAPKAVEAKAEDDRTDRASHELAELQAGLEYWFTVQSINGRGVKSKASAPTRSAGVDGVPLCLAVPGQPDLVAPTEVKAVLAAGSGKAELTWQHPAAAALKFRVVINGQKGPDLEPGTTKTVVAVETAAGLENRIEVLAVDPQDEKNTSPAGVATVSMIRNYEVIVALNNTENRTNVQAAKKFFTDTWGRKLADRSVNGVDFAVLPNIVQSEEEAEELCRSLNWAPNGKDKVCAVREVEQPKK